MSRDIQLQMGNGILLLTASKPVLIRPYLKMKMIPFDLDSRFGFVVEPRVVDIFVELEMSNSNQGYDSDPVVVVVVVRRFAHQGLMLTEVCLYLH